MNNLTKNIIRFFVFVVLQTLIFNQLEIGYGFHLMIHPLFVMLLPFELGVISLMGLAFLPESSLTSFQTPMDYMLHPW